MGELGSFRCVIHADLFLLSTVDLSLSSRRCAIILVSVFNTPLFVPAFLAYRYLAAAYENRCVVVEGVAHRPHPPPQHKKTMGRAVGAASHCKKGLVQINKDNREGSKQEERAYGIATIGGGIIGFVRAMELLMRS